jgi:N-acetylmuramoyl-L-alanine amidase
MAAGDGSWYTVKSGDWVSKIATRFGFSDWKTVWNHPQNVDLRDLRGDPNVIFPGDQIYIPPVKMKDETCPTDKLHQFRLKKSRKKLKLILRDAEGEPRKNVPCRLEIDHRPFPRVKSTNGDGLIEASIPELSEQGVLMVGEDGAEVYQLLLGQLDPIETVKGYQERLANLGHYVGEIDGDAGPLTRKAVRMFQTFENLREGKEVLMVDGIMGPKTRERLKKFHGY